MSKLKKVAESQKIDDGQGKYQFAIAYKDFKHKIQHIYVKANSPDEAFEKMEQHGVKYLSIEGWDGFDDQGNQY
jgi:hypothetical protein